MRKKVIIIEENVEIIKDEARIINQAVKRNISRFPERFCFKLTQEELENLKSQNVISSLDEEKSYEGRRKLPIVFTVILYLMNCKNMKRQNLNKRYFLKVKSMMHIV